MKTLMSLLSRSWQVRTAREQLLLGVMGGLTVLLLVSLLVIQPLVRFNDYARTDYAAAIQLYRSIQADARTYREMSQDESANAATTQSLRSVVASVALRHEISLARMVPTDDGALTVNIDRAPTQAVMRWLVDLDQRHHVAVMSSTLDREGEGLVSASLVLRRAGG